MCRTMQSVLTLATEKRCAETVMLYPARLATRQPRVKNQDPSSHEPVVHTFLRFSIRLFNEFAPVIREWSTSLALRHLQNPREGRQGSIGTAGAALSYTACCKNLVDMSCRRMYWRRSDDRLNTAVSTAAPLSFNPLPPGRCALRMPPRRLWI